MQKRSKIRDLEAMETLQKRGDFRLPPIVDPAGNTTGLTSGLARELLVISHFSSAGLLILSVQNYLRLPHHTGMCQA